MLSFQNWPTSALQTWPLQPSPLTAYTSYGLNLLTPAQLQNNDDKEKLQKVAQPALQHTTNYASYLTPQYLSPQQQYFAFNSAFFNAPFGQFAYTTGQQYLPQLVATIPSITPTLTPVTEKFTTTTTTEASTQSPKIKNREPTTRKPQGSLQVKPPKLQLKPDENTQNFLNIPVKPEKIIEIEGDFKSDKALLKAVEKINPEYVIEEIINVPGKHVFSSESKEQIKTPLVKQTKVQTQNKLIAVEQKQIQIQPSKLIAAEQRQNQLQQINKAKKQKKLNTKQKQREDFEPETQIKVEAIGKTSTKGNIPEIPFGTYFLPYFSQNQQQHETGKKPAALILEPHSKAIVGNGGTAISTPISKAYLKRGVTTNVYFNPESVAIAGVGGKAHAQADLESSDIELNEDAQTLPYYGGLKGHFVHLKDGQVQKISGNTNELKAAPRQGPVAAASSQIALTVHDSEYNDHKSSFEEDFNKIQLAAARLVAIQELAKRKGTFSPEDNRVYAASLLELGQAAQNLAMLQQTGQIQDFSVLLQPMHTTVMPQKTPVKEDKNAEDAVAIEAAEGPQKVDEVTEQQLSESDLLPPSHEDPYEDVHDSVAITPPKKDASVAEAKPVGISIAGEGGVASAKPNAVALSGRNGLAVSAPKATAIAGVTAEEAAAFSISLPTRNNLVIKSISSRLSSSPSYDEYDDIDTSPLRAHTRNVPFLRSAGMEKSKDSSKAKPMMATLNAADAIVKMWRTAIAEDHAADYGTPERNNDFDIEQFVKISKQMNNQRRRI
ncbi:hypothetical protein CVS40_8500 [Lucilia cuprina]|nr:hypothetical protein CVS40_8500 [Lucilia cuprina]